MRNVGNHVVTVRIDVKPGQTTDDAAIDRIADLEGSVRAAIAELNVIRQIAHGDPDRVKMLAENAIAFLRVGIEKQ